jgi:hypothetical protein
MKLFSSLLLAFVVIGLASLANGQLQLRRHQRHPADSISFVQVQTKDTLSPTEIIENMKKIEAMKNEVRNEIGNAEKSISQNENKFEVMKKEAVEKVRRKRERAANSADRQKNFLAANALSQKRSFWRVVSCLKQIKGGANHLYWSIRKMLAKLPEEQVCPVFKAFKFPSLSKHGHTEKWYSKTGVYPSLGEVPATDGSEIIFYDSVKLHLWRCMCTEEGAAKKSFKVAQNPMLKTLEKTAEKVEERSAELDRKIPAKSPEEMRAELDEELEEQANVAQNITSF